MTRKRILLALLAVALVAAVLVVLREQAGPPPEAGPTMIPVPSRETALVAADFADERHWFGLRAQCWKAQPYRCARTLVATADGVPRLRELPEELRGYQEGQGISLLALGPSQVLAYNRYFRSWYSADAGQSWTEVRERAEPVDRIPAGAVLERDCTLAGCEHRVMVVLPDSGRRAELRGLPPLTEVHPVSLPDRQGRWRVVGLLDGKQVVLTSADHGRTWQVRELPPGVPAISRAQAVPAENGMYLKVDSSTASPAGDIASALYRAQGEGWELVWRNLSVDQPLRSLHAVVPGPGDRLTALDQQRLTRVSEDGGRTFRRARPEEELPGVFVERTRIGHLLGLVTEVRHSVDGVRWTPLPTG
ncbi:MULTISPECIES: sialidase family protein [unclassified Crossiella]|uniref:sialidase family protein n=1 Tax=unclassified Crossiella TaxID=2620835 RepID=UPI001FFFCB67|nr:MULTISPECIES: sialidase family protein [unclassified Crossiella]MCK2239703.1 glycoside hydrolase [Crossiella sp. S99.2]MCK2252398.1 glycoside hydrolase [Crossiella sp. S99.1]